MQIMSDLPRYSDALSSLAGSTPHVAHWLQQAEQQRAQRLASSSADIRLKGLEQLYIYLDAEQKTYAQTAELAPLAWLIGRVGADFVTAVEATLSGYAGVAFDAIRDVMEIEALLLDFATKWENAEEWLTCDDQTRRRKFSPVKVRERLSAAGVSPYANDDYEPFDYQGHSEALHVGPAVRFGSGRGYHRFDDSVFGQVGYMEMFEHGRRILDAVDVLRSRHAPDGSEFRLPLPMNDFFEAGKLTHTNQSLVMAMLSMISEAHTPGRF
jgi:hypothetical protein